MPATSFASTTRIGFVSDGSSQCSAAQANEVAPRAWIVRQPSDRQKSSLSLPAAWTIVISRRAAISADVREISPSSANSASQPSWLPGVHGSRSVEVWSSCSPGPQLTAGQGKCDHHSGCPELFVHSRSVAGSTKPASLMLRLMTRSSGNRDACWSSMSSIVSPMPSDIWIVGVAGLRPSASVDVEIPCRLATGLAPANALITPASNFALITPATEVPCSSGVLDVHVPSRHSASAPL